MANTQTITQMFEHSVCEYPNNTFLLEKTSAAFKPTTYRQTRDQVYRVGAGLQAIGIKKGDTLALLSEGRNRWIISELGIFFAGAISVPLSVKLEESNDLLFRIQHSEAKAVVVSKQQLPKIRKIADKMTAVEHIIILDDVECEEPREITFAQLTEQGEEYLLNEGEDKFLEVSQSLTGSDYATITYTSGTTAEPKGVILTHRNYTANVEQALTLMDIDETWRTLVILPLDHCFAHVVGFMIFMHKGASVATVQVGRTGMETLKNIPKNINEIKPHLILSVPALAKNFKKSIEQGIRAKGNSAQKLFRAALAITQLYNGDGYDKGKGARSLLKPLVCLFDKILFSKVRENFGGELKLFIGGGALLDKDLQKFFYATGMPMFQGYGLSEATPVISSNSLHRHRFGSSGELVKPLEIKICDTDGNELPQGVPGEMVIKGENVMAGYWKNPVSTAETVKDGWLYTGDLGYIGDDGLLYVLGRFKSLLIGADGEKYSPEGIEEAMVQHSSAIDQIMLYNNQNAYTGALIVPNKDALNVKLRKHHKTDLSSEQGKRIALDYIWAQIARFKGKGEFAALFPDRWLPAAIAILEEPFSEQNRMINSTMKMVRPEIEKRYADRIDYLFTPEGKQLHNEQNLEALK